MTSSSNVKPTYFAYMMHKEDNESCGLWVVILISLSLTMVVLFTFLTIKMINSIGS